MRERERDGAGWKSSHPVLERTRDYLILHAADRVTLDDLAALAGLSRFHLNRTFRRAYGLPPHAYQLRLRAALAREALDRGLTPSEIDVGFADQSHLGRHFKRHWGVTPGQYAALLRGKSRAP
jgi:AraC-like DNA-binding protein